MASAIIPAVGVNLGTKMSVVEEEIQSRLPRRVKVNHLHPLDGFKIHDHEGMPPELRLNDEVIYRTISRHGDISHVHHPIKAKYVNWTHSPMIGRVLDYKVVKSSKEIK
jgi:hypothetical protein